MKYIYSFIFALIILTSCVEDPDVPNIIINGKGPEVKTVRVDDIATNSATIVGTVSKENGSKVIERGFCWNLTEPFELEDALGKKKNGEGLGEYTEVINDLADSTEYFVRAYAINASETSYGEILSFKTRSGSERWPVVVTNPLVLGQGSLKVSGTVTDEGSTQRVVESGICWSTSPNPSVTTGKVEVLSSGRQTFSGTLLNLHGGTTYYVKAYAKDIQDRVSYGQEESVVTPSIFENVVKFEGNLFTPGSAAYLISLSKNGYLLGGSSETSPINELWSFSPSNDTKWTKLQQYPLERAWIAATSTQHGIFAYGGTDENGNLTDDFYQYNYNADMWSQMVLSGTETPGKMSHAAACFHNNYVYYIGGITAGSKVSNEIWGIMSRGNASWEKRRSLDEAQYSSIALLNDVEAKLYVGLGKTNINSKISSRRFWSSTDNGNSWQAETSFPEANKSISAGVVYKNMIYVIDDQGSIWAYNTGSKTWQAKSKAPTTMAGAVHCMYSIGNNIYIGMGSNNTIISYNPDWDN